MTITADPKENESIAKKLSGFSEVLEVSTSFSEELVIVAKVGLRIRLNFILLLPSRLM